MTDYIFITDVNNNMQLQCIWCSYDTQRKLPS